MDNMWFLLMLSVFASADTTTLLTYRRGDTRYALDRSKSELVFHQSPVTHRITLKPCNKKLIGDFLSELERRFDDLPISKGPDAFVQMGKVKRQLASVLPTKAAVNYFDRVPQIFLDLSLKDRQKCGK